MITTCMDFLPSSLITDQVPDDFIGWFVKKYYHISNLNKNCFYGLNLQWPEFDLSDSFDRYFLSFHTEYIDIEWVIKQSNRVYPKQILLVTDYKINKEEPWSDNISFARYVTIHHQLDIASQTFDVNCNPTLPEYKLSSLSMRISQYKRFVTAYLLQNFNHDDMMLSYHNQLAKPEDLHWFPEIEHLNKLDLDLEKTFVNVNDESKIINNSPIYNANWHIPAFTNSLFNCTNESFHYTNTIKNGCPFKYPTAYLTDKTFKPLLAGRPFIPIGQAHTIKFLNDVGFNTNFGLDFSYDRDNGDLTRIKGVFDAIDSVRDTDIKILFDQTFDAVLYNCNHIQTKELNNCVQELNKNGLEVIKNWLA